MPDGAPRERARTIELALRQLSRLSEKLLQLAKAEGGGLLAETPHDLTQVLRLVLDDLARDQEIAARLDVVIPPGCSLPSHMDPDAFLRILVRNLVENALKHSPVNSLVTVALTYDGA